MSHLLLKGGIIVSMDPAIGVLEPTDRLVAIVRIGPGPGRAPLGTPGMPGIPPLPPA